MDIKHTLTKKYGIGGKGDKKTLYYNLSLIQWPCFCRLALLPQPVRQDSLLFKERKRYSTIIRECIGAVSGFEAQGHWWETSSSR
jgi:hypothetical protein